MQSLKIAYKAIIYGNIKFLSTLSFYQIWDGKAILSFKEVYKLVYGFGINDLLR